MGGGLFPPDDFEATIRVYGPKEGGRRTPAFNGIRWDFVYADDGPNPPSLYMIWPVMLPAETLCSFDPSGYALAAPLPLPAPALVSAAT
jgi:hypothetical protein